MDQKQIDKRPETEDRIKAMVIEGKRLLAAGDVEGARECFLKTRTLIRAFGAALANLAWLLERAGALEDAEKYSSWASTLLPENSRPHFDPTPGHERKSDFAEAETACLQRLRQSPDSPGAWTNMGVLLVRMKREDEAERCHRTAIGLNEGYSKAYFNLAYVLLRRGSFEEGWRCLESRTSHGYIENHFTFPRWRGESLRGKSLIIGFEGGHGDMIHFCRYASELKAMGAARISVACQPGLKALFGTLTGVDEALYFPEQVPATGWDFWTLPLSLPYYCQTRLHNIPAQIPYLRADPARVAKWSSLLPPSGFRVGLVWKGNPRFENDENRSLPSLEVLAPLGRARGVHFISLQKGHGEKRTQRPPAGLHLLDLGGKLRDFADTAAIISGLDLVISVDTAVVHLAGAMGKPCWVLLPDQLTDWRWLTGRSDSPWYPKGMRLFRQGGQGGWSEVVATVLESLVCFIKERGAIAGRQDLQDL